MGKGRSKRYLHLQEEWTRLYNEEGLNFSRIAKKFGVQSETVSRYIKNQVSKETKSPFKQQVSTWLSLYQKGKSFAEIARMHQVSETAVKKNIYKELTPIIVDLKWTFIALYKKGYCLKSIAKTYNLHPKIVLNIIKEEVCEVSQANSHVSNQLINQWVKLYKEGLSFLAIAEKYKVSSNTVYRNLKDKVTIRNKKTNADTIKELIPTWKVLYQKKGFTLQEIGEMYHVSSSTVYKYVRDS